MKFFLIAVAAVVIAAGVYLYGSYVGVFSTGLPIRPSQKYKNDETVPFKGIQMILILTVCTLVFAAVQMIMLNRNILITSNIKLSVLYFIVAAAAVVDSKKRIIPNALILFGLAFRMVMYLYEFLRVDTFHTIIKSDLIGFAIGFGLLALVSLITRQGIGFGDAKLFAVIGILGGVNCTICTLFISLIASAVASIILLATHKVDKKGSFPFGPCIALGYAVTLLISNY